MKSVSSLNIILGIVIGFAVLYLKIFISFSLSQHDLDIIREKTLMCSNNTQKDSFFFIFKTYIFFTMKQDDEITVRVFRVIGLPMATFQGNLRTGEIWEVR